MIRILHLLVPLLIIIGCSKPVEFDSVITNISLFDGHNDRGIVNVAINADTIAEISSKELSGKKVIDGTGKFMIPGLVNAHAHVAEFEQLKTGFPLGILTILNMHTGLEEREAQWKLLTADSTGLSRLYGAGHAATVPGGHPNQFSPDMETINDSITIKEWVDHRIAAGVDYIKIVRDSHEWMGEPPLPTLGYEQIGEIIEYAHSKGYKVVIHSNTIEEMESIAGLGADGFVHMPDYKEDYPIPDSFYQILSDHNTFVITTGGMALKPLDGAPPFITQWLEENLLDTEQRAEIIRLMNARGIMLVVGTDAQTGQMDFGEDYFLELELYRMAGLSPAEILKAATANAGQAFDLPIGEITPGGSADFLLLTENPLEDIGNLRKIHQVWKNGSPFLN